MILTIDNGTQSYKALVFDLQEELQVKAQVMFEPYFVPKPGWAEQGSQVFWQALCSACQQLWHRHYEALYRQVYLKMYKRLKPFYEKIREIAGYPD